MVSVLIPCYKADAWLFDSLQSSASALSRVGGEILLVLDRLEKAEVAPAIHKLVVPNNVNMRIITSPGVGIVDALNFGIQESKFDFIARMDSDDVMLPNRIEEQYRFLQTPKNTSTVCVGGNIDLIDDAGTYLRHVEYPNGVKRLRKKMASGSYMAHPAVMFRKSAVVSIGKYRDIYKHAEDFDLWIRLLKVGNLDNLPITVLKYRQHPGQDSNIFRNTQDSGTEALIWSQMIAKGKAQGLGWFPDDYDKVNLWLQQVKELNNSRINNLLISKTARLIAIRREINEGRWLSALPQGFLYFLQAPVDAVKILFSKLHKFGRKITRKYLSNIKYINHKSRLELSHIHVILKGGIGNQMFQYAFGHTQASSFSVPVYFNRDFFADKRERALALDPDEFTLEFDDFMQCRKTKLVIEKGFHWASYPRPSSNCVTYDGYWQSWRYVNPEVRAKLLSQKKRLELFHGITIHIRGTDYLTNSSSSSFHGQVGPAYYIKALSILDADLPIRVVTDDIEYSQNILKLAGIRDALVLSSASWLSDFEMLRESEFVIIANSSFSWWAAFLGEPKMVVAPRKWFSDEALRTHNTCDLLPNSWILC